jgi:hypothetical protein
MKKYIEHLKNDRTPHERRRTAMQIASIVTAFVFVVWVSTLGLRYAQHPTNTDQNLANTAATLIAVDATTTAGH